MKNFRWKAAALLAFFGPMCARDPGTGEYAVRCTLGTLLAIFMMFYIQQRDEADWLRNQLERLRERLTSKAQDN